MCGSQRSTLSSLVPLHCNVLRQGPSLSLKFTESANWLEVPAQEHTCNHRRIMASFLGGSWDPYLGSHAYSANTWPARPSLKAPDSISKTHYTSQQTAVWIAKTFNSIYILHWFPECAGELPFGECLCLSCGYNQSQSVHGPNLWRQLCPMFEKQEIHLKQPLEWYFPISLCCFRDTVLLKPGALFAGICYKVKEQRN